MFRKVILMFIFLLMDSVLFAKPKLTIDNWSPFTENNPVYSTSGIGTREAEEIYHISVASWMDATGGKQGIEPGAISYEGGPVPINTAFNNKGENNERKIEVKKSNL